MQAKAENIDEEAQLPANTLSRIGEGLARLEGRTAAQIDALRTDTSQIRQMGHDLQGELQKIVAVALTGQTAMRGHMEECAKRGARLEKIGFLVLTAMITALGFLMAPYFHISPH